MTTGAEVLAGAGAGANGAAQSAQAGQGGWLDGLPQEDRGWAETKGYKGPADIVRAHRGLEKLLGAPREKLLRLPEKDDAPEWGEVYGRLGRPEKADEYGIEGADPELLAKVHAAGLSKRQATELAAYLGERSKAAQEKAEQERDAKSEADLGALRREWGAEFDANVTAGQRAAKALGWDVETAEKLESALGTKGFLQLAARLGRGLGEHGFVSGENGAAEAKGAFGMTPSAARAKYESLEGDPEFQKRLFSEDGSVRRAAVAERQRLALVAFPEESGGSASITA